MVPAPNIHLALKHPQTKVMEILLLGKEHPLVYSFKFYYHSNEHPGREFRDDPYNRCL
jgi:hypothetical protein